MPIEIFNIPQEKIAMNDAISSQFEQLQSYDSIRSYSEDKLDHWTFEVKHTLNSENPLIDSQEQLQDFKSIPSNDLNLKHLEDAKVNYLSFCQSWKIPLNAKFWDEKVQDIQQSNKQKNKKLSTVSSLLIQEWQKNLDQIYSAWALKLIQTMKERFLQELQKQLEILQKLFQQIANLGLDPGMFLDFSDGNLSEKDIQAIQNWATYLSEDKEVQKICELMGRMQQLEQSEKIEQVIYETTYQKYLPDINSREEIVGIRLGQELEHILPTEKGLLSDPELSILFDLKLIENRLMCFDMQGLQLIEEQKESIKEQTILEEEQGPMIICIDTSGSMNGMPETIAKAMTLYMAMKAKEKSRPCYLINFSTHIDVIDLSNNTSLSKLIQFLKMSFHGGTDAVPALQHALEIMKTNDYKKADLLMISDFIMASLPKDILNKIELQRHAKNHFYSLVIGPEFLNKTLQTLFDKEWVYNPDTSNIYELIHFKKAIHANN